jgi:hypothetical protein
MFTPSGLNSYNLKKVEEIIPIFRWTLSFIFIFLWWGVVIGYLKEFRVNYVMIFESNPANRLHPSGMYILFAMLIIIWLSCMIGEVSVLKGYLDYDVDTFAIIMLVVFTVVFFNPSDLFQSVIRFPTIIALFNWLLPPISEVRFLEFFIADVWTSLVKPFIDIALITCWAVSSPDENVFANGKCNPKMFWAIFAWFLPFHIRFLQCVNKWWHTGDAFPHLVNAGKYLASMVMIVANYFYGLDPELKWVVFGLCLFASAYAFIWDTLIDFGLWRDSRWLRKEILYPPHYYYVGATTNFILRFIWLLGFLDPNIWPYWMQSVDGLTLFLGFWEIYRRGQWNLFRLENENINNYEKYRTVLEIPRLPND